NALALARRQYTIQIDVRQAGVQVNGMQHQMCGLINRIVTAVAKRQLSRHEARCAPAEIIDNTGKNRYDLRRVVRNIWHTLTCGDTTDGLDTDIDLFRPAKTQDKPKSPVCALTLCIYA